LRIVLQFCEKFEDRYKLIFVKKGYLIDIMKDKGSYCENTDAVISNIHIRIMQLSLLCIRICIM
jgi:hypothetical protein